MIVGIVGGGQLARMLALAGYPLGLKFKFLDPSPDACAGHLGGHINAEYTDPAAIYRLADASHAVTFEFENVPAQTMTGLAERVPTFPPAAALAVAQDRLREKTLFRELGIPTPEFAPIGSPEELTSALDKVGLPAILKTRTLGYDGKGQVVLRDKTQVTAAWARLGGVPCIVEKMIPFDRELSIIAVRGQHGAPAFYPLTENDHRGGILHVSRSRNQDSMQAQAEDYARRLMQFFDYVGVMTLELFQVGERLLANEIAPRVHNSGHWTIEGAVTSQFENHLRAILGLPLGNTAARGCAAMVNLVGVLPDLDKLLAVEGAHVHIYGKESRPGRKLGHVSVCMAEPARLESALATVLSHIPAR